MQFGCGTREQTDGMSTPSKSDPPNAAAPATACPGLPTPAQTTPLPHYYIPTTPALLLLHAACLPASLPALPATLMSHVLRPRSSPPLLYPLAPTTLRPFAPVHLLASTLFLRLYTSTISADGTESAIRFL